MRRLFFHSFVLVFSNYLALLPHISTAVQDRNLRPPRCALRVAVAAAKSRGVREFTVARRGARTSLNMTGFDGFTIPFSSDASDFGNRSVTTLPYRTPTRLPGHLSRNLRRQCAKTGDIFSGIRSTHGGGGFATEGDVYFSPSGGQENDWMVHLKEFMPAFEKKF